MPRLTAKDRLLFQEFAALFRSCAVCWWPESDMRRRMEIHHLMSGPARKHDRRNLLSLCARCHDLHHRGDSRFPVLNNGILLTCKAETDPDYFDPAYLAGLRHRKWLGYDPAPLPEYFLQERQSNLAWPTRQP
jgi:hypothetical protein